MPKLIVLFFRDANDEPALAEAAAAAAKSIRFMEVDVRAASETATRHHALASADAVLDYDGVVLIAPDDEQLPSLTKMLHVLAPRAPLANTVFGIAGADATLLDRIARLGGIIVTPGSGGQRLDGAKWVAERTAKVAGWVRHGLGHEAEHGGGHSHDHHHHQHHDHGHSHA